MVRRASWRRCACGLGTVWEDWLSRWETEGQKERSKPAWPQGMDGNHTSFSWNPQNPYPPCLNPWKDLEPGGLPWAWTAGTPGDLVWPAPPPPPHPSRERHESFDQEPAHPGPLAPSWARPLKSAGGGPWEWAQETVGALGAPQLYPEAEQQSRWLSLRAWGQEEAWPEPLVLTQGRVCF